MDAVKTIQKGHLTGYVYESAEAMGQAAADYMEKEIIELLKQKEEVTLLLSAGISQHTFHTALAKKKSFDWGRVNLMEIDEEIGLPEGHKVLCATGIKKYFHEAGANYKEFFAFKSDAEDTDAECRRFEQVLKEHEPDLAFIGIGINGHVALNEPGQGTFDDDRAFSQQVLIELSLWKLLKNSVILFFSNFGKSMLCLFITLAILGVLFILVPFSLLFILLLGFSLVSLIRQLFVWPIMNRLFSIDERQAAGRKEI